MKIFYRELPDSIYNKTATIIKDWPLKLDKNNWVQFNSMVYHSVRYFVDNNGWYICFEYSTAYETFKEQFREITWDELYDIVPNNVLSEYLSKSNITPKDIVRWRKSKQQD